jgi:hypothetical protein
MNQEKNIQNKYRIEPLEPRLMMDASVDESSLLRLSGLCPLSLVAYSS